jgi:hypothetical protein
MMTLPGTTYPLVDSVALTEGPHRFISILREVSDADGLIYDPHYDSERTYD